MRSPHTTGEEKFKEIMKNAGSAFPESNFKQVLIIYSPDVKQG